MAMLRGSNLTSKEVARLLGVSEASVKRWADRGLLPSAKTAGGHRRFRPHDIAVFKRAAFTEEKPQGFQRAQAREAPLEQSRSSRAVDEDVLMEETFNALIEGRSEELSALLINLHMQGQSVAALSDRFLCPSMRRVGDLWHRGELSVAGEHVATSTANSVLRDLRTVINIPREKDFTGICCSTEEDFHQFPVQLCALTMESCGLQVLDMGTSTPFFALANLLSRFQPNMVVVASTILISLDRAVREYADFHKAAQIAGTSIVLGGAGFSGAEMRKRFPADLHGDNFQQVEDFINGLA